MSDTPQSPDRPENDTGPEEARAPNDAPGAPSATTGEVAPSGAANQPGGPGTDLAPTEEQRAEAEGRGGQEPADTPLIHGCPVTDSLGATVVHCDRARYVELCRRLKADGYAMPASLLGVDYLTHPGRVLPEGVAAERFEVVLELVDLERHRRIRVRCQVPEHDPSLPSVYELWPGVDFHERETYDMFGIRFDGHPDLARLLMPDDWEGHPLRKDYDTGHVPVQFKEAPR